MLIKTNIPNTSSNLKLQKFPFVHYYRPTLHLENPLLIQTHNPVDNTIHASSTANQFTLIPITLKDALKTQKFTFDLTVIDTNLLLIAIYISTATYISTTKLACKQAPSKTYLGMRGFSQIGGFGS
jgi:hypothetical protein